ncbi:MAG: ABC transporter permease [Lachnospiraceae bacterium]|nr:ABC transporter permease [Lachnospiraceae bacterium]
MKVANKKCIRHLSIENMKAARFRNAIAVLAIALTTILFTVLFTVLTTLINGYEQTNFRQEGGYNHAEVRFLTLEQFDTIKSDPLIKEYGMRQFVGLAVKEPFNKNQVEISYCDSNTAKWYFLTPTEGSLPAEGTNEIATDTKVLSLLGIKPELGAEVPLTFQVENEEVTKNFVLSGWWEADPIAPADHVLLSKSQAEEILSSVTLYGDDNYTGKYTLSIMFRSDFRIIEKVRTLVERYGYSEDHDADNYLSVGVNWGYVNTDLLQSVDWEAILTVAGILLLIISIGYLIIYNVFRIAVEGSIRYYGLLKTIGTTGRQIKRMLRTEAVALSAAGIPLGLLIGYLVSVVLTPAVITALSINAPYVQTVSVNPFIFIGSAVFSLVTVFVSVRKPGKAAAKVSPIEALRFTEGNPIAGKRRKRKQGASVSQMAWANLFRSKSRTAVTLLSMCLSLVLLNLTFTMTNSFDIEAYIGDLLADFVVSDSGMVSDRVWGMKSFPVLSKDALEMIENQENIAEAGRVYASKGAAYEFITEEQYISEWSKDNPEDLVRAGMQYEPHKDGLIGDMIELYGMEPFCMGKLNVLAGDISKLSNTAEDKKYIAFVCDNREEVEDDIMKSRLQIGDTVTIRYGDKMVFYGMESGEIYEGEEDADASGEAYYDEALEWHDIEYEVAALVTVPYSMGLGYYGLGERFLLDAESFIAETGVDDPVHYLCNMEENCVDKMEAFLSDYTGNAAKDVYYDSRQRQIDDFNDFYRMFLVTGISISFIIGLVGVLNFLNSIVTGILARRREFAVLQSVGMTGTQLKGMLITEGLCYAVGSVFVALLIFTAGSPVVSAGIQEIFPFMKYHFTIMPIFVILPFFVMIGILVPLVSYRIAVKKSVVERLREAE